MPDRAQPPAPLGPVRHAWFAGLIEGRPGDVDGMKRAVASINALRIAHMDLALDGGRFSALFDERAVAGDAFAPAVQDELIRLLGELLAAAADPGTVESTLRCTAVHDTTAVETLFAPMRGAIHCVSRHRPVQPTDLEHAPDARTKGAIEEFGRRRAVMIGLVMLLAAGMLIWQSGLLERFRSVSPEHIEMRTGPFGDLLTATIEPAWGNYRVILRRGASYPDSAEDATRLEAAATTAAHRAAANAVSDGDPVFARVHDSDGGVLAFATVSLRALLVRDDAEIVVHLPGRSAASAIELALDPGQ